MSEAKVRVLFLRRIVKVQPGALEDFIRLRKADEIREVSEELWAGRGDERAGFEAEVGDTFAMVMGDSDMGEEEGVILLRI